VGGCLRPNVFVLGPASAGGFPLPEWLGVDEAAKYLGVSTSSLYSLAQHGRVPGNKLGKMWRFSRRELDTWMRAQKPIEEFFVTVDASVDKNLDLRDPQREGHRARV
jgi:excisionase family DNA binding protein